MAIESGAKNGIIAPDWKTVEYLKKAGVDPDKIEMIKSDEDAVYCQEIHIDVSDLVPYVAVPHSPANGKPIKEVEGTPITQVMIGTCTNGRVEDFEMAADIIKGHKIPKEVRCIIMPARLHGDLRGGRVHNVQSQLRRMRRRTRRSAVCKGILSGNT